MTRPGTDQKKCLETKPKGPTLRPGRHGFGELAQLLCVSRNALCVPGPARTPRAHLLAKMPLPTCLRFLLTCLQNVQEQRQLS